MIAQMDLDQPPPVLDMAVVTGVLGVLRDQAGAAQQQILPAQAMNDEIQRLQAQVEALRARIQK
jgi:hypothetical protein